jgi:hypothetical protein
MNQNRQNWNAQQQQLRQALNHPADFELVIDLFLRQHAAVHAAQMSGTAGWSFADEVWRDLNPGVARRVSSGGDHSIAWLTWHIARIEDVTMNLLLVGRSQVLHEGWQARLHIRAADTGNGMSSQAVAELGNEIDLVALQDYRNAVGLRTRENIASLTASDLKKRVDPLRVERVRAEGAVLPAGSAVIDYWLGLTLAGLLLMPPTRHNFIHLNEALRLKQKR